MDFLVTDSFIIDFVSRATVAAAAVKSVAAAADRRMFLSSSSGYNMVLRF